VAHSGERPIRVQYVLELDDLARRRLRTVTRSGFGMKQNSLAPRPASSCLIARRWFIASRRGRGTFNRIPPSPQCSLISTEVKWPSSPLDRTQSGGIRRRVPGPRRRPRGPAPTPPPPVPAATASMVRAEGSSIVSILMTPLFRRERALVAAWDDRNKLILVLAGRGCVTPLDLGPEEPEAVGVVRPPRRRTVAAG